VQNLSCDTEQALAGKERRKKVNKKQVFFLLWH
jgi:hypothetical protein